MNKEQLDCEGTDPKFLVMDKQNGKVGLAGPAVGSELTQKRLEEIKDAVSDPSVPPDRGFDDVSTTNGNRKLGINCSYCAFKGDCWPSLRVFNYSRGPVFLTSVKKVPKNVEITHLWRKDDVK